MSDLIPQHRAPVEVKGPLMTTGMGRGLHTWVAIVLAIAGAVLGLIGQSLTASAFCCIFLGCAVGLLGELPRLLRTGEIRARSTDLLKPDRYLVIRREDSPAHFYFHVITYLILGGFSLIVASLAFSQLLTHHVK